MGPLVCLVFFQELDFPLHYAPFCCRDKSSILSDGLLLFLPFAAAAAAALSLGCLGSYFLCFRGNKPLCLPCMSCCCWFYWPLV